MVPSNWCPAIGLDTITTCQHAHAPHTLAHGSALQQLWKRRHLLTLAMIAVLNSFTSLTLHPTLIVSTRRATGTQNKICLLSPSKFERRLLKALSMRVYAPLNVRRSCFATSLSALAAAGPALLLPPWRGDCRRQRARVQHVPRGQLLSRGGRLAPQLRRACLHLRSAGTPHVLDNTNVLLAAMPVLWTAASLSSMLPGDASYNRATCKCTTCRPHCLQNRALSRVSYAVSPRKPVKPTILNTL